MGRRARVRGVTVGSALVLAAASLGAVCAQAQDLPWQKDAVHGARAPEPVRFAGPEQVSLRADTPQTLALHFQIQDGFHINSHSPHSTTLIPTQLVVLDEAGVSVAHVEFPPGSDFSFSFAPADKLSVYSGELSLLMHLKVQPGEHGLQAMLRYQACDNSTCLPPRKLPVNVSILAK